MTALAFAKGHGTGNDFVILQDTDANIELTPELVRALCNRRTGIGADGVLRAARAEALVVSGVLDKLPDGVRGETWFMDYRNADGSVAEMCGNGVRVFAHWLSSRNHTPCAGFSVGTRGGKKHVTVSDCDLQHATVTVDMGLPEALGVSTCDLDGVTIAGLAVSMGNPHLACIVPELVPETLARMPVEHDLVTDTEFFPNGVNVEFATALDAHNTIHMRVKERGSGETLSCGTGTVAAAYAALADHGETEGEVTVHERGGTLVVKITAEEATLTGPSVILAAGMVNLAALGIQTA